MNLPIEIKSKSLINVILFFIFILAGMVAMYILGYNQCTINVADRMHQYDDKGEECYTREEVDSFIYGDRWTEVY